MSPVTAQVLTSVAKTFGVMGVGFAFQRFWKRDIEALTDLTMKLFIPCLAFTVVVGQDLSAGALVTVAGAAAFVVLGGLLLAWPIFRVLGLHRRRGLFLPVAFMNAANLPFPIIEANYGRSGLGYAVLYYVAVVVILYSLGVGIVARTLNPWILLRTPVTIATLAGFLVQATHIPLPGVLVATVDLLGQAAIPVTLFIFGYSLGGLQVGHLGIAAFGAVLRLVFGVALGWLAADWLGLMGVEREVVILMSAMPSAVINVVIARQYDADAEIVASIVFLSSLAAVGVLPALLVLLRT